LTNGNPILSETPVEKKDYNLPEFDHNLVNRRVTKQAVAAVINELRAQGATVTLPYNERSELKKETKLTWDDLGGSSSMRDKLKDLLRNATDPDYAEVVQKIAASAGMKDGPTYPKTVLFSGPPGTGKTLSVKIMADQAGIPMVNVVAGNLKNKWLGSSEKKVKDIFALMRRLAEIRGRNHAGPASILFMDEIDGLVAASERSRNTSGILTTFLEEVDGFNGSSEFMFVSCTNDKAGLDPAFVNRIAETIQFNAPSAEDRKDIFKISAKHLTDEELETLSTDKFAQGLTGRDIANICESAIHQKLVKLKSTGRPIEELTKLPSEDKVPTLNCYIEALKNRVNANYKDDDAQVKSKAMGYGQRYKGWMGGKGSAKGDGEVEAA